MKNTPKIGWIGTGIMGTAMASNLLKKGLKVIAYNRTISKTEKLASLGAAVVKSPNEIWNEADIAFLMLTNDKACQSVFEEKNGILDSEKIKGKVIVNSSTISPEVSVALAKMAKSKGATYLDAPVSGSAGAAKGATLLFLVGGDEKHFKALSPILDHMGKKNYYLGDVSQGNKAKLAINYLIAINYLAIGEMVDFAQKLDIQPADMMDIINNSGAGNVTSKIKTDPIVNNDFSDIAFSLDNMLKDIKLGKKAGNDMPLLSGLLKVYSDASKAGYGDKDVMEILTFLRKDYHSS